MAKGYNLGEDEVAHLLTIILEKSGALKGLSAEEKGNVVNETIKNLSNVGIELNRDNIQNPAILIKLGTALAATFAKLQTNSKTLAIDLELLFKGHKTGEKLTKDEQKKLQAQFNQLLTQLYNLDPNETMLFMKFIRDLINSYQPSLFPAPTNRPTSVVTDSNAKLFDVFGIVTDSQAQATLTVSEATMSGMAGLVDKFEKEGLVPVDGGNLGAQITREIADAGLTSVSPRPIPPV